MMTAMMIMMILLRIMITYNYGAAPSHESHMTLVISMPGMLQITMTMRGVVITMVVATMMTQTMMIMLLVGATIT